MLQNVLYKNRFYYLLLSLLDITHEGNCSSDKKYIAVYIKFYNVFDRISISRNEHYASAKTGDSRLPQQINIIATLKRSNHLIV